MVSSSAAAPATSRWSPAPITMTRLAFAGLLANIAIVATGGLVRLTDSGLGCPSWPDCTGDSLVPTSRLSWHSYVEFGNRMFTYVVVVTELVVLVAALRQQPARRDVRRWAWVTLLGVPAQAVLGGVTVLTHLNPWAVSAHFMASMLLVSAATVLWWRVREDDGPPRPVVPPLIRRLAGGTWVLGFAVLYAGTVVTGSGPHAGDASAHRTGLKPSSMSQLHADLVMLLVGVAVALAVAVTALQAPAQARRACWALVGMLGLQAVIGFAQYFDKLPIGLVEAHVVGAACIAALVTAAPLSLRRRSPVRC